MKLRLQLAFLFVFGVSFMETPSFASDAEYTKIEDFARVTVNPGMQALFVEAFMDAYKDVEPSNLKPQFTTKNDVEAWLAGVPGAELEYCATVSHQVFLVSSYRETVLRGFAIVEQYPEGAVHIRQMAVLPLEQRQGYAKALLIAILAHYESATEIIWDTRKVNKVREIARSQGATESIPHDPELTPEKYVGFGIAVETLRSMMDK